MKNTVNSISEKEIVTLLRNRDIRAMDPLYDQYGNYIYGLVCKIISCEEIAETVLQDTFLKVWNKIETFSIEKGRFITWMINIARNTAIDMVRSKYYKQTAKLTSLEHVANNAGNIDLGIRIEHLDIRDIVSDLGDKYGEVIELIYFEGYTQTEVAEELGIPLGTVKGRVRKAYKDLRIIFEA